MIKLLPKVFPNELDNIIIKVKIKRIKSLFIGSKKIIDV